MIYKALFKMALFCSIGLGLFVSQLVTSYKLNSSRATLTDFLTIDFDLVFSQ